MPTPWPQPRPWKVKTVAIGSRSAWAEADEAAPARAAAHSPRVARAAVRTGRGIGGGRTLAAGYGPSHGPGFTPRARPVVKWRGVRVLVTTRGSSGHLGPLVPFARACARAGHEVAVAAQRQHEANVRRAGLAFDPVRRPAGRRVDAPDGVVRGAGPRDGGQADDRRVLRRHRPPRGAAGPARDRRARPAGPDPPRELGVRLDARRRARGHPDRARRARAGERGGPFHRGGRPRRGRRPRRARPAPRSGRPAARGGALPDGDARPARGPRRRRACAGAPLSLRRRSRRSGRCRSGGPATTIRWCT